MVYPSAVFSFITGPIRIEPRTGWVEDGSKILPHLQKYSRFGLMMTWPFCFHFWLFWRLQQGNDISGWIPGTEQGIYFRTLGYRWDADLGMKWTWGYFGL